jgi:hypothetical protein
MDRLKEHYNVRISPYNLVNSTPGFGVRLHDSAYDFMHDLQLRIALTK